MEEGERLNMDAAIEAANAAKEYRENPSRENYLNLIQAQDNYRDAIKRAREVAESANVQMSIYDS